MRYIYATIVEHIIDSDGRGVEVELVNRDVKFTLQLVITKINDEPVTQSVKRMLENRKFINTKI